MSDAERTEEATPQRLRELRKQGRVVKSLDLNMAVELFAAILLLQQLGGAAVGRLRGFLEGRLADVASADLSDGRIFDLLMDGGLTFGLVMLPLFVALPVLAIVGNVGQMGGLLFSAKGITPDFNKINPATGFSRLFSLRSLFELVKSLLKVGVVAYVLYRAFVDHLLEFFALGTIDATAALPRFGAMALAIAMQAGFALLVLGAIDYAYQRWDFKRNARMTRQELIEEMRQSEGDPQTRARIRRIQRKFALSRMMAAVPEATVVVTNPTHLAIALRYEPGMPAPKVVAKGADHVALRIRQLAEQHRVPLVENKPLAQALFRSVEVDTEIPVELFQAVAEVLAYIYRLRGGAPVQG